MKSHRNLSGIYFRQKAPTGSGFDNVCFEDLEPEKQDEILATKDVEFIKALAKGLADTINRLGDQFDIVTGDGITFN